MNETELVQVVQKMQDFIELNITRSITLYQLSYITGYSPWYVAKIFKEVTGKSPYEYIRLRRLTLAALMLRDRNKKVIDVALDFVYDSQEGFTRAFSKEFGVAPGKYRLHNQPINLFLPEKVRSTCRLTFNKAVENMKNIYFKTNDWKLDDYLKQNNCTLEEIIYFKGERSTCWHMKGKNWTYTILRQELDGFKPDEELALWFWAKIDFFGVTGNPMCFLEMYGIQHYEERSCLNINSRSPYAIAKSGCWVLYRLPFKVPYAEPVLFRLHALQVNIAIAQYQPGDENLPGAEAIRYTAVRPVTEYSASCQEAGIYALPAARVIGKSVRMSVDDHELPTQFTDEYYQNNRESITAALPCLISGGYVELMEDYHPKDDTVRFMVGTLTPAGTLVPEGFEFRDIEETAVFIGKYGEWYAEGEQYWNEQGYAYNESRGHNWDAFLHFDGDENAVSRLLCPLKELELLIDYQNKEWEITKVYTQDLPAVRFIGIKYGEEDKKDGTHIWKWADWFENDRFAPLEKLVTDEFRDEYENFNSYAALTRSSHYDFLQYWIGMLLPAESEVPEGYDYIDLKASKLGVCLLHGLEDDVYCREENCGDRLFAEGLQPIPDENGAWWRIERHVEPRFSQKDAEGKIILDLCHFVK